MNNLPSTKGAPAAALSWSTLDWPRLERLRAKFLARDPSPGSYWTSREDLANYDFTYAQRIGWKWDAVLRELELRGWRPPAGPLLDWGCGSGVAGRRVLEFFGAEPFGGLQVFDRSRLAMDFALDRVRQGFPGLDARVLIAAADRGEERTRPGGTLVISHVLNELDDAGQAALRGQIHHADAVLWVEPGTHADSRALIGFRELLRADFDLVAPCTHQRECGMLRAHNRAHWCHHFAAPPPGLAADADWVRFGRRAGIDLRSVPYSFLVLARKDLKTEALLSDDWSRVIGEPRLYKGFAKVLDCSREDVREVGVQARDNPELLRAFKKGRVPTLLHGTLEPGEWKRIDRSR